MTATEFASNHRVELVQYMGGDDMVALAAWVSFNKDNESKLENTNHVEGLIDFLWRNSHTSPFEHSVFTFAIETPIFVAREFMRHRAASYNEMSGRYTVLPSKFYLPAGDRPLQQEGKAGNYYFVEGTYDQQREAEGSIARTVEHCVDAYERMLNAGIAKEVARMILPVNIYTRFYVTMNARNLLHFLTLRTDPTALYEIRQVAGEIEEIFKDKMPMTYKAYKEAQQ